MASKPSTKSNTSKKEALRKAMRSAPEGDQLYAALMELSAPWEQHPAHDRAAAIVGVSYIEYGLKIALCDRLWLNNKDDKFDYLFEGEGAPLNTFDARIKMAKAFRIVDDADLKIVGIIRRIRNAFAHSMSSVITFETEAVADLCDDLKRLREETEPGASRAIDAFDGLKKMGSQFAYRRSIFSYCVFQIFWKLTTFRHEYVFPQMPPWWPSQ